MNEIMNHINSIAHKYPTSPHLYYNHFYYNISTNIPMGDKFVV
jgi:hypothetical protein